MSEKMGSGTQVDQDDFKTAVKQFAQRIKAVDQELDAQVKSQQAKAAESFESARVQSAMVFGLNDEHITGVDAPSNSSIAAPRFSSSIALNPLARATANKRSAKTQQLCQPTMCRLLVKMMLRPTALRILQMCLPKACETGTQTLLQLLLSLHLTIEY